MTANFVPSGSIPKPLYWLSFGAFAIGTEGFMIAPLLSGIASDLGVTIAAAGQLVTAFALAYALSSPVLAVVTGNVNRRRLLIACLAAFAAANLVAVLSQGYWQLMGARLLLAFTAGLYVPSANAVATALVAPTRRGTALSIVTGGTSLAIALGVPLGAIVGHMSGWRTTFGAVAILASIATLGLASGLPRGFGDDIAVASLDARLAVARNPRVLLALLVTTLWATGAYTFYTYVGSYMAAAVGLDGAQLSVMLFAWGLSAACGVFVGGRLTDKIGAARVIGPALVLLATAFVGLWLVARWITPSAALVPVAALVVLWGMSAWSFFPAQQARLIGIAGAPVAPVALSLNASFMFLGFSLGAMLGAVTLSRGTSADLGWVAALCELAALLLSWAISLCPAPGPVNARVA
ncbi:MFS transporter [Rhodoferax koreensis]|uniref:MFS transporter n=1 Tax=Rhodoferax koreensis TaxID=1842727 RepID=UPI0009FABD52|nr:MFS transporter [Rhodoferax koreense]